jgi:hypothetical protein
LRIYETLQLIPTHPSTVPLPWITGKIARIGHLVMPYANICGDRIVMSGEVVLVLDDEKEITMKQGDIAVQRGTIHAWRNYTDQWARIYFILLAAEPLKIGGKELGGAGYKLKE